MGLVLRKTKESEYTRLGVFAFVFKITALHEAEYGGHRAEFNRYQEQVAWLNDCEPQTITVI